MCLTNKSAYFLNAIGLLFEMVGVIIIFFSRDKGLLEPALTEEVFPYTADNTDKVDVGLNIPYIISRDAETVLKDIKDNIRKTNDRNNRVYQKSGLGLILIIMGFLSSLIATLYFLQISA